jgi:hypothetical protein
MEILNGFADQRKPEIAPYFALKTAVLSIADNIYLTNLQKRENRSGRLSPDNTKMQVG